MLINAIYVHVPFCRSICAYCDFKRVKCNDILIERWLKTLKEEITEKKLNIHCKTCYIGGGTPTALDEVQLEEFLRILNPYLLECEEVTIEVNPETMNHKKIELLKKYHVNRVSIGLQTTSDRLLQMMNRKHTLQSVKELVQFFRKEGIENISLDCMYSLPTQSREEFRETLKNLVALDVPHLSLYSLTIEENSEFGRLGLTSLDSEIEEDMYFDACRILEEAGYEHYEISNFAKEGYRSKHNQVYWHYQDFYGIGLGASGKEKHIRYDNTGNFEKYFHHEWIENEIKLSKKEEKFEMLMMGLRLKEGILKNDFEVTFGESIEANYPNSIKKCKDLGWIEMNQERIWASESGFPILNSVLEYFLEESEDEVR